MDQPGQNESKYDPAPGTTTVELAIETGEKRPLRQKLNDCFWALVGIVMGFGGFWLSLNSDFNKIEKWTHIAAMYAAIVIGPLMGITYTILFLYYFFILITGKTIYQEKQIDNKIDEWKKKYGWPILKWGCLSLLIVVGLIVGLILLFSVFGEVKEFFNKTPGWAIIIIFLLIILIINTSKKKK